MNKTITLKPSGIEVTNPEWAGYKKGVKELADKVKDWTTERIVEYKAMPTYPKSERLQALVSILEYAKLNIDVLSRKLLKGEE